MRKSNDITFLDSKYGHQLSGSGMHLPRLTLPRNSTMNITSQNMVAMQLSGQKFLQ